MLQQLRDVAEGVVARPFAIRSLRRFGVNPPTPTQTVEMAIEFSRLALEAIGARVQPDVARQGGADLLTFIARLPAWLRDGVAASSDFPTIACAWDEPRSGCYAGLCATVQDVWEHMFGPEALEDEAIIAAIQSEGAFEGFDFGCGAGHFSVALALMGSRIRAYDVDAIKLAFLRHRCFGRNFSSRITIGPPNGEYDAVIALNVLDHLEHPETALVELIDHLKQRGRFFLAASFPNDGWHQANEEIKDRVFGQLALLKKEESVPRAPSLEVFRKERTLDRFFVGPLCSVSSEDRPRLHPDVHFVQVDMPATVMVGSRRFYVRACYVSSDVEPILRRCDGQQTLAELIEQFGCEEEELLALFALLWRARLISMA